MLSFRKLKLTMKNISFVPCLCFAAFLGGCATAEKIVSTGTAPNPQQAYVGGNFTINKPVFVTAFVLTNQETQQEHIIPFTGKSDFKPGQNETNLVAVPPGSYKATHWMVYNAFWGASSKEFKTKLSDSLFTAPFQVRPGEVVFLGKFIAQSAWTPSVFSSKTEGDWTAMKISRQDAQNFVQTSYPQFGQMPISCIACIP
jgi:hypothetical protein